MPVNKECQFCKKHFVVPNRRHEEVKFCSRECKTQAGYIERVCACCGKTFKRKRSDNADSRIFYCSRECSFSCRLGRKLDKRSPEYCKVCEVCGVEFSVTKTRIDTARWCSRECQGKDKKWKEECATHQVGSKSWKWTGGVYALHDGYIRKQKDGEKHRGFEHRQVIQDLMLTIDPEHPFLIEVDGRKKLDSQIEVHHIDRNRANNAPDNLLAVTKYAHAQIHHRNRKPMPWECWPTNPTRW